MSEASKDEHLKSQAKQAAGGEAEVVRELVRQITLQALTQHQLDRTAIERVVRLVGEGVAEGIKSQKGDVEPKIREALLGMDDALKKSAHAAKLATQEAIGQAKDFVAEDLQSVVKDLSAMEGMFIDTINVMARQSGKLAESVFKRMSEHYRNSGTQAGQEAKQAVMQIQEHMMALTKQGATTASITGRRVSGQIAQVASGILSGMADALTPHEKK